MYLNKNICLEFAEILIKDNNINMTELELAQEIYAHTYLYYKCKDKKCKIVNELYKHCADGIDIDNNGDTFIRKMFYKLIWRL